MARALRLAFLGLVCLILSADRTWAWHARGHGIIGRAAVAALPEEVPEFLRKGAAAVAHSSVDPDAFKQPWVPQLSDQEGPEHYLNMDLLPSPALPPRRSEYLQLLAQNDLSPRTMGFLPYAVSEWTQRLTVALAEHRAFPEDRHVQAKCLVYAGILAHYAGDLCQPLHCTKHFDGRVCEQGRSPRSGIHRKVDGLIDLLDFDPAELAQGLEPKALADLFPGVMEEMMRSFALVDRVYELEARLPGPETPRESVDPEVTDFARQRARVAAGFVASLYLTAWRDSASAQLPDWLIRARKAEADRAANGRR